MVNLASFTGPKAFGKAYQYMIDNDAHAQGSVDRQIASSRHLIYGRPGLAGWPSLALRRGQVSMTVTIRKANEAKQTSQHEVA